MTKNTYKKLVCAVTCVMLFACGDEAGHLQTYPLQVALDDALLFASPSSKSVRILDLTAKHLEPKTLETEVSDNVMHVERRLGDHNEAVFILQAESADDTANSAQQASALALVGSKGVDRTIPLEPKFTLLQQSPDGHYGVLFGSGQTDHLLDNQAEIAVVDLNGKGEDAVSVRALDGLGAAPAAVAFAPELMIEGVRTQLLVVLSYEAISLLDLQDPSAHDTTIDLRSVSGSPGMVPQLAFDAELGRIYAIRPSSPDIVVIDLVSQTDPSADSAFRPVLSTLSLPSAVGKISVYSINDEPRLLCALPQQNSAAIVDPVSGDVQVISPQHAVENVISHQLSADQNNLQALLVGSGAVSTVSLQDVEAYGSAARIRTLVQNLTISRLVMVEDANMALVVHSTGGLSLLDLAAETSTPFATKAFLTDVYVDKKRGGAWIAASGEDRVAFLDLRSRTQRELSLDAPIEGLYPILKQDRIVALHDSPWGYATVVDANQPKESRAQALLGFLATGIAD